MERYMEQKDLHMVFIDLVKVRLQMHLRRPKIP